MKTIIITIVLIISWIWLANCTVTFHPFSVKFERPYYAFLWIVLFIVITQLMRVEYLRGTKDTLEEVKQLFKDVEAESK